MKFSSLLSLTFLFMVTCTQGFSQEQVKKNLPPVMESWNGFYMKLRLTDKFFYYQENHYRRRGDAENPLNPLAQMGQLYNRLGVTYLVNSRLEATLGPHFAFRFTPFPELDNQDQVVLDFRIWHQYILNHSLWRAKVLHQFRFEHRWRRDNEINSPHNFSNRWRYKIAAYIPLNRPRMENRTIYLYPSNEFLFEGGKHIPSIFEENRVYTAIGYVYGNFQFFAGHMWTYGPSVYPTYRVRHIIRLNVSMNLDLRKDTFNPRMVD